MCAGIDVNTWIREYPRQHAGVLHNQNTHMNLAIFLLEASKKEEIVSTVHRSMNFTTDNFTKWRKIETINNTNKSVSRVCSNHTIPKQKENQFCLQYLMNFPARCETCNGKVVTCLWKCQNGAWFDWMEKNLIKKERKEIIIYSRVDSVNLYEKI